MPSYNVSTQALQRLPSYIAYLKSDACAGLQDVSARRIATALGLSEIQVRKDLSSVSRSGGRPKLGFDRLELITDMEACLGFDIVDSAALVGAGRLGQALLHYEGFAHSSVKIVAAFDTNPDVIGTSVNDVVVYPAESLEDTIRRMGIHIGIITTPAASAQAICDSMVDSGILAIWNFAPTQLKVPNYILVRSENMAGSLTLLSHHLAQTLGQRNK
ncbi:MAG: redox-sensing transcriptional repressor Rex [Clostridiaceae bacterium]|nr:redox-sensing transcriptional repressor Rex [Clostridiales bacterium]MDD6878265.1 redox-sensing transcriptional repressor Rex [Clostridiaceae bacterium]MDY3286341.1 redox-sensing transcriptional repressor Rex [Eubacteriales bacterium]